MKLHGSHRSPYVQKVRVFIREKGVPCEFLDNRPASVEVRAINPLSQIPTLELEDGSGLYDSSVIVEYIDGAWPEIRSSRARSRSESKSDAGKRCATGSRSQRE